MEIPEGDFRIKNKIVKDNIDVGATKSGGSSNVSSSQGDIASEQIDLSAKAKEIQQALEIVKNTPDIRTDKVNRIRTEITAGRYQVDNEAVAEKILQEIIADPKFPE